MRNRFIRNAALLFLTMQLLFAAVFSGGCEKQESPGKESVPADTIVLAVKKDQTSAAGHQALEKCLSEYIDAFKKAEPGTDVRIKYYTELPKETTGIDCMLLGADDMLLYAANGLTDAAVYLESVGIAVEKLAGGAVNTARISENGKLRMIPFNYDHAVIIADAGQFSDAGVEIPDKDWNLSGFESAAEALTGRRDGKAYSGVYMPYYMNYVWQYFCNLLAGSYLTEGRFDFSKTGNVGQALERMYSLYAHNYAFSPVLETTNRTCAMSFTFACEPWRNNYSFETEKKTAINPGKRVDELLAENKLVLLPLPKADNGKRTGIADTDYIKGFAVPASSAKQNMAGKLAAFSVTEEGQKILISYYGGIPANRDMWGETFWRTGVFAGDNAERALIGVDDGVRDDFTAAISGDNEIYNKNIRMRTVFSAVMVREFGSGKGFDKFIKKMAVFQEDANAVIDGKKPIYTRE